MVSKFNHPAIDIKDLIKVEGEICVISQLHHRNSLIGACEVVTNSAAPVCRDVLWDGQQWTFSKRPSFVESKCSRLQPFIAILQSR